MILIPLLLLIGLAVWPACYLVGHDRGEREPVKALWAAFGLGALGAACAVVLESAIPSKYISTEHPVSLGMSLLLACLAAGLIEEICKFAPAAWYLYRKRYFNEHTDGIIYFAIAGLGFGVPENILYVLEFGVGVGFVRVMLTPFFHAAMTGLVGYYLVGLKLDHKPKPQVVYALIVAAITHGLYDFGLLSRKPWLIMTSLLITFGCTVMLFLLYRQATRAGRAVGLSVVGNNSFCRACGFANPKHHLHWQSCGEIA